MPFDAEIAAVRFFLPFSRAVILSHGSVVLFVAVEGVIFILALGISCICLREKDNLVFKLRWCYVFEPFTVREMFGIIYILMMVLKM